MKNLKFLEKKILKLMVPYYVVILITGIILQNIAIIASLHLGLVFGYLGLKNLMASGAQIAASKTSSVYFKNQFIRLSLFAIPLSIALAWKNYFNLPIILLSLFAFQVCFVGLEVSKGLKSLKKKKKESRRTMDELGVVNFSEIALFGQVFTYQKPMFVMTWIVMAILVILAILTRKKLSMVPSKLQSGFELIIEFLDEITVTTLGKKDGRKFLPLVVTVFVFVLLSNWISILPNVFRILGGIIAGFAGLFGSEYVSFPGGAGFTGMFNVDVAPQAWYSWMIKFPHITEPTKYLATDLGLAILVLIVAHTYGIRQNGFGGYLKGYMGDVWPTTGLWKFIFFLNPFLYMNIMGEISNTVSHAFRLFGNIFGGGMIIVIVSSLIKSILVPVGLLAFFGLFAGIVQAFVFTMLTVTYIAQQKA